MNNKDEIDLKEIFLLLLSKLWLILIVAIVGGAAAFCYSKFCMPLKYSSHISMYVQSYTSFNENPEHNYNNQVKPSARGELEITTLNDMYLSDGLLDVQLLGRGFAWLDTGTMQSLLAASNFVEMVQNRQGITISAPKEIAFINGWIDKAGLLRSAEAYGKSPYGAHLRAVAEGKVKY